MKTKKISGLFLALFIFCSFFASTAMAADRASTTMYIDGDDREGPYHVKVGDCIKVGLAVDNDRSFYTVEGWIKSGSGLELVSTEQCDGKCILTLKAVETGKNKVSFCVTDDNGDNRGGRCATIYVDKACCYSSC